MRHGVGIPAFGEHGDRHNTSDVCAESSRFANGVHDFAQKFGFADVVGGALSACCGDFASESGDLGGGDALERRAECLARFELLAVN